MNMSPFICTFPWKKAFAASIWPSKMALRSPEDVVSVAVGPGWVPDSTLMEALFALIRIGATVAQLKDEYLFDGGELVLDQRIVGPGYGPYPFEQFV